MRPRRPRPAFRRSGLWAPLAGGSVRPRGARCRSRAGTCAGRRRGRRSVDPHDAASDGRRGGAGDLDHRALDGRRRIGGDLHRPAVEHELPPAEILTSPSALIVVPASSRTIDLRARVDDLDALPLGRVVVPDLVAAARADHAYVVPTAGVPLGQRGLSLPAPEAADDVRPARVAPVEGDQTSSPTSGRK